MSITIKIKVTKEIMEQSAHCGEGGEAQSTNCAFTIAVKDIFPFAHVAYNCINPNFGNEWTPRTDETKPSKEELERYNSQCFDISPEMTAFIRKFDFNPPKERLKWDEQEFELEIPDWVIEKIDIQDIINSPTLSLAE